jgi:hypothetical protein
MAPRPGLLLSLVGASALVCVVLYLAYASLWQGDRDGLNHAVGRDFINMWTASQLLEAGRTADIFDQDKFAAAQRRQLGPDFPFHFWSYPPQALLLTSGLSSLLHYKWALAAWLVCGLFFMLLAARLFWPGSGLPWLLLLAPSGFVNILLGQNGFITTALAVAGFAVLPQRAVVAGIMFGLLTFKPQLGILIPIALIAMRQWSAMAAAAVTAALLLGLTHVSYGGDVWLQFWQSTMPHQMRFMAEAEGPFQWMMPGWFMAGRIIGLPLWLSQAVQAVMALAAVIVVYRAFRGQEDWRLKVAILFVATFVASPQGFNYDMGLVSVAILCLVVAALRTGWRRGEFIVIALCWVLPLTMMPLNAIGLPVAPLLLLALLACLYGRREMLLEPDGDVAEGGMPQGPVQ